MPKSVIGACQSDGIFLGARSPPSVIGSCGMLVNQRENDQTVIRTRFAQP